MRIKDWKILSFFLVLFICYVFFYCLDGMLGTNTVKIPELMAQYEEMPDRSIAVTWPLQPSAETLYPGLPSYKDSQLPSISSVNPLGEIHGLFGSLGQASGPYFGMTQPRIMLQDFIRGSDPSLPYLRNLTMPITYPSVASNEWYGMPGMAAMQLITPTQAELTRGMRQLNIGMLDPLSNYMQIIGQARKERYGGPDFRKILYDPRHFVVPYSSLSAFNMQSNLNYTQFSQGNLSSGNFNYNVSY